MTPWADGSVFVVDRNLWGGNYGKRPTYVLVRDRDRDLDEEFWLSKDLEPNNGDDVYVQGITTGWLFFFVAITDLYG
nr:hypothetical protein [Haliscomenobacter sp.]